MANTGNKPKTNVEAGLYTGRTSHGGADGLGKYDEDAYKPQVLGDREVTQPAKGYGGDTPNGWLRGAGDRPHFDNDTTRKGNDAPLLKGGGDDGKRDHFSRTSNTKGRESDWSADYKPRKY